MEEEKETFWSSVKKFFSDLTMKVKVVIGAVLSILGLVSVFLFAKNMNQRKILELELKKVRKKIEIEKTQEEIDKNSEIIASLEDKEAMILEQLKELEDTSPREEVSKEELDEFFDERGF